MTYEIDLATKIPALKGARILCVGDLMLDRFVYGAVERISPEAPVPVLRIKSERAMMGAAGRS
jgi:D-beta-D-heptose 7-phosphate kinase/D-beta-D-heptose 1-phosphate adenosyltransferase